jgi:molybdenum cofactor cytidylyltransferase
LIAAIVLAAGKSERMGTPKALLPLRGRTFLDNILEAISQSSVERTVVVVGHHKDEIEGHMSHAKRKRDSAPHCDRTSVIFNADYEQGMITSLQAGIRALPPEATGALLFLVDHPLVQRDTIDLLIKSLAPGRIVLPTFKGRRGHPVLFASDIFQEILSLTMSQGANIVVRKDPSRVVEVSVDFPGILVDVDTPEDFRKLQNEHEPR